MNDTPDGLQMLEAKVERRSRSVSAPRRPRDGQTQSEPEQNPVPPENVSAPDPLTSPAPTRKRQKPTPESIADERPAVGPEEPLANLMVRVRRPLDERLTALLYAFRRDGVRSSKTEIIEMLLWELPSAPTPQIRERLGAFRRGAPREEPL